jgi:hypothetical protein
MPWPPRKGELLPRCAEPVGIEKKLRNYSLVLDHEDGGPKAKEFRDMLGIGPDSSEYLEWQIRVGITHTPITLVRPLPSDAIACTVQFHIAGRGRYIHRTASPRTVWVVNTPTAPPRLITALTREGAQMSTTHASIGEPSVVPIGELDEVVLFSEVDGWGMGTTGTVVAVSPTDCTIEIFGYLGESLDFIEVASEERRLVWKCPQPDLGFARSRAIAGAAKRQTTLPIRELDVVSLLTQIDGWPAGTTGTVISEGPTFKEVEISNHLGEDLAWLDVPPDQLRVVRRSANRNAEAGVD